MDVKYFTDGSNIETLRVELGEVSEVDPEKIRQESEAKARQSVDQDRRWSALTTLAEQAVRDGEMHYRNVDRTRSDYKPERFSAWHQKTTEDYAGTLREKNRQAEELFGELLTEFPGSALQSPVTNVDGVNLNTRLRLMGEATPDQVARIVRDGVDRNDGAFLDAARILLESWPTYRNAWQSGEGKKLARDLLEEIEMAAPDFHRLKGIYAREQVDTYRQRWRYLLVELLSGDGRIDPVHRQVGALAPLLESLSK